MFIKLADFGSARGPGSDTHRDVSHERKASFVGTAEYCSPELLNDRFVCEKSDVWAVGVVFFQVLSGRHPFRGSSEYQTFQKILHLEYVLPHHFHKDVVDLLKHIFILQVEQRLGLEQMKQHVVFKSMDWNQLYTMKAPSLYTLPIKNSSTT